MEERTKGRKEERKEQERKKAKIYWLVTFLALF